VVVPIVNGTPGTAQVAPGTFDLYGVACPSATTCEAVGVNASSEGVVVPITNGTPGTGEAVPGTHILQAVACSSSTTCEAVGDNASFTGVAVPITNGTPGTAQVVSGTSALYGVGCPSSTACEAVGIDSDFDRKLSDFYGRILAMFVSALNTGHKLGVVRPCDADVVARCPLGSVKEVVHWAFVEQDPMKIDMKALGREVIAHILKGCLA
jgi:hypothetical protein